MGLPKKKMFQGFFILLILFVVFGFGQALITNILGVAYPIFMSFQSLEPDKGEDDKQWLTYWVVFGMFSVIDQFAGFVLSLIPFYYVLKMAVLIWLFHPATNGATQIYYGLVQPFWKEHEEKLDQVSRGFESTVK